METRLICPWPPPSPELHRSLPLAFYLRLLNKYFTQYPGNAAYWLHRINDNVDWQWFDYKLFHNFSRGQPLPPPDLHAILQTPDADPVFVDSRLTIHGPKITQEINIDGESFFHGIANHQTEVYYPGKGPSYCTRAAIAHNRKFHVELLKTKAEYKIQNDALKAKRAQEKQLRAENEAPRGRKLQKQEQGSRSSSRLSSISSLRANERQEDNTSSLRAEERQRQESSSSSSSSSLRANVGNTLVSNVTQKGNNREQDKGTSSLRTNRERNSNTNSSLRADTRNKATGKESPSSPDVIILDDTPPTSDTTEPLSMFISPRPPDAAWYPPRTLQRHIYDNLIKRKQESGITSQLFGQAVVFTTYIYALI